MREIFLWKADANLVRESATAESDGKNHLDFVGYN
jgi:hypothetical protein